MSSAAPPGVAGTEWRPRAYLLLAGGAAFLVLAVAARAPVLVLLAVPLLVAPIAAAFASPGRSARADLAWRLSGLSGDVRIAGELRTEPARLADDLALYFERPADLVEVEPPRVEWSRGRARIGLRWRAVRPTVQVVPPPEVLWTDPMGLLERGVGGRRTPLAIDRFPLDLYRLGAVRLERTRQLTGKTRTRYIGPTGEFFAIRPAQPNEPPRRINWRASARSGRWLANEFEVERTGDLILLVDTRATPLGPVADERFLSVSRAAAVGIVGAFLRQKARVGYAAFGEFLEAVPLSSGRTQSVRLRQAIRNTRHGPVDGPSERCAVSLRRFFAPGVTVLLFSTLGGEAACDLVVHLRHRGFPVIVLNPSWRALVPPRWSLPAREERLAGRLAQLERRMNLATTRAFASVVDWRDLGSLGELTLAFQRPRRGRF